MTWTDRQGQPLPYDAVFAAQLWGLKRRLGGMVSRSVQRRAQDAAERQETRELIVRTGTGTHVYRDRDR